MTIEHTEHTEHTELTPLALPPSVRAINTADIQAARERMNAACERLDHICDVGPNNYETVKAALKAARYALKDSTDDRRATDRALNAALEEAVPGLVDARALTETEKVLKAAIERVDEMLKDHEDPHRRDVFAYMVDIRATVDQWKAVTKAIGKAGATYTIVDSTIGVKAAEPHTETPQI